MENACEKADVIRVLQKKGKGISLLYAKRITADLHEISGDFKYSEPKRPTEDVKLTNGAESP